MRKLPDNESRRNAPHPLPFVAGANRRPAVLLSLAERTKLAKLPSNVEGAMADHSRMSDPV